MLGRILLTSPSDIWSSFFYSKSHDGRCASWLWYFLWQSPFWHWSSGEPQDKLCGCSKVSLVRCSHLLLQLGCAQGLLLFNSAPTTESCHSPHTCEVFAWMRTAWLMTNNDNNCNPPPPPMYSFLLGISHYQTWEFHCPVLTWKKKCVKKSSTLIF